MTFYTGQGMLVFPAPDPLSIRAVLPNAKTLMYKGEPHIAVRHDLDAVAILRNLGVDAPSPVNSAWTYPGRYRPFDHQRATVEFLTIYRRAFVLSGLGSGKTSAALWASEYLREQGVLDKVVIVCPKSCTHKVWEDEIFNTLMHRSAVVVEGSRERKLALAAADADYVIVNHDGLSTVAHVLAKDPRISLFIYDEASVLRNAQTQRHKTLKSLLKPSTRLWLLTATPCPHQPTDAWALARLVRPETVPPYFLEFKRKTMLQVSNFKWVPRPEALQLAYEAMQPAIRFRTEDCIDLPPITYQNRECDLSAQQITMLKQMRNHMVAETDEATITAANAAVKLTKILQIAQGCIRDNAGEVHLIDASDRLATLREIIEEADRKIIVWCPFRSVMEPLKKALEDCCGVEIINGETTSKERSRIISAFKQEDQEPKVLLAQPATAAHGLSLISANICVWYGPTFSAELYEQANARVARPGQKHHMTIIHLGATSMEWDAYDVATTKVDRQKKILDMYRKVLANPTSVR